MDIWDHFAICEREIRDAGLDPDEVQFMQREGSHEHGRIWGRLSYTERSFLQVSERVAIVDGRPERLEYAYYMVVTGIAVWAHERDPTHVGIEDHRHDRDHNTFACEPISLKAALEKGWETVADEDLWVMEGQQ